MFILSLFLCCVGISLGAIGDTQFSSQVIDTGDDTTLRFESYGMPFEISQPKSGSVNVKFGTPNGKGQRESISFQNGPSYIWVLNQGGAKVMRRQTGKEVVLTIRGCDCEEVQKPIQQIQNDQVQVTPSVYREELPLSNGYSFNVESTVRFHTSRRPNCVDVVIGEKSARYSNEVYNYAGVTLNITNYTPERVRLATDRSGATCTVGQVPTTRTSTTTTTTTSTTTTARVIQRVTPPPYSSSSQGQMIYEQTLTLQHGYSLNLASTIPIVVQQNNNFEVNIKIGSETSAGFSRSVYVYGLYRVEIINYSSEPVEMDSTGKTANCVVGHVQSTSPPTQNQGVHTQLLQLNGGLTFEIAGKAEFQANQNGNKITVTVGSPIGAYGRGKTTFTFGDYEMVVINYTSEYVIFEQQNEHLKCLIGMNP